MNIGNALSASDILMGVVVLLADDLYTRKYFLALCWKVKAVGWGIWKDFVALTPEKDRISASRMSLIPSNIIIRINHDVDSVKILMRKYHRRLFERGMDRFASQSPHDETVSKSQIRRHASTNASNPEVNHPMQILCCGVFGICRGISYKILGGKNCYIDLVCLNNLPTPR